jgi:hypothetical protein
VDTSQNTPVYDSTEAVTPLATDILHTATISTNPQQTEASKNPTATISPTTHEEKSKNEPLSSPTVTPTETSELLSLQDGSPLAMQNFTHPELGCNWWGIAGQIMGANGKPMLDSVLEVGGDLNGQPIFGMAVTGESSAYGPGGYEIKLGDRPVETRNQLFVIVYNLDGVQISRPTYFSTTGECDQNLILLNFVQTKSFQSSTIYLPSIYKNSNSP